MAEMTPAAWLEFLDRRLVDRWEGANRERVAWRVLEDYFKGKHPLSFATPKYRMAFGNLLEGLADNWCQIVVSASVQRLQVQGFRFGDEQQADEDAWAIWQANGLDAESNMAHTEAVKLGEAYWLVAPPGPDSDVPKITAEHPSQVIVATSATDRRVRLAALKKWFEEDEFAHAIVYLPNYIVRYRSQEKVRLGQRIQWVRQDALSGRNPLGVVPVIPIQNSPSMLHGGQSDFEPGLPIQDAINKLATDMMVASEFAAFRQRVMTGVEIARFPEGHPKAGEPMPIEMGVSRLMTVEAADAKVYDLDASELSNYTGAIEMWVNHYAAQTQTPPHYLLGRMANISGDALTAAEAGLNSKVDDKKLSFGDAHEEAVRLAFLAIGDKDRARAMDAETLWADSERRSVAQIFDAAVKGKELGIPNEVLWEDLGWSPQKIARVKAIAAAEALLLEAETPPDETAPAPEGA